jgi:G3E family GTPase
VDDGVASHYLLDAIITVVDARHAMEQLTDHEEAQRQVGFADRILISKTDLVSVEELAQLTTRITSINPRAAIGTSHFGETPIADILDIRGFNLNDKLDLDPAFLGGGANKGNAEAGDHAHAHEHDHEYDCADPAHDHHHAHHSDDIKAFVFTTDRPFDSARLDEFLGGIVQVYGPRMLRYKGVLSMNGSDHKIFFQGVHQIMGSDVGPVWATHLPRNSKMVFIGKNLPEDIFIRGLEQCLV